MCRTIAFKIGQLLADTWPYGGWVMFGITVPPDLAACRSRLGSPHGRFARFVANILLPPPKRDELDEQFEPRIAGVFAITLDIDPCAFVERTVDAFISLLLVH